MRLGCVASMFPALIYRFFKYSLLLPESKGMKGVWSFNFLQGRVNRLYTFPSFTTLILHCNGIQSPTSLTMDPSSRTLTLSLSLALINRSYHEQVDPSLGNKQGKGETVYFSPKPSSPHFAPPRLISEDGERAARRSYRINLRTASLTPQGPDPRFHDRLDCSYRLHLQTASSVSVSWDPQACTRLGRDCRTAGKEPAWIVSEPLVDSECGSGARWKSGLPFLKFLVLEMVIIYVEPCLLELRNNTEKVANIASNRHPTLLGSSIPDFHLPAVIDGDK